MAGNTVPDRDDIELFRRTVGEVQPIVQDKVLSPVDKPRPIPIMRQTDEDTVLLEMAQSIPNIADTETGEELVFKRTGVQHRVLQKLRRGQFSVEAELDLHGMTVATAATALASFLTYCQDTNLRCARIIHGKGRGSKNGKPVLKSRLNHWLQQRDDVLAFCSARPMDGGTGAVYILIKRA